MSFYKELN